MREPRLLLASTSRYRRDLLERLKLPFECQDPAIDEAAQPRESPPALARRLAAAKARAVAERHPDALVIGADQVASVDGTVLGKPGDSERAVRQLLAASGKTVTFYTAVSLERLARHQGLDHLDATLVTFRALSEREARRYVALDAPLDCAGSFRSEGLGITLIERLDTQDPTALVGLPLLWLAGALRTLGLDPLAPERA
jgi:septum formation protein